jgi:hypothetical protein
VIKVIDAKTLERAVTLIHATQQGRLNKTEALEIRTVVASSIAAKRRYHQAYTAPTYEWKKPAPRR